MSTNGLDRASRASRGKRIWKLLDEEVEADDEFWNQEAFREDAEDNEYATEDEEADIFDSDFDEDEPDEEFDIEEDESLMVGRQTKKRNLPPGTYCEKEKKTSSLTKEGVFHVSVAAGGDTSDSVVPLPNVRQVSHHQEYGESILDTDGERSVRKSTRTAVVIKQAEREAHQAALLALSKPVKKKKEEERKISQEEMLLEAAQTEIQNVQALEVMLAREEEVKLKATIQKALYGGPQIRFHSRCGKNILEFTKVNEFPQALNSSPMPYPKKIFCVITGLPAKYRDPKSDLPYATKEAFEIIRQRFNKGENPGRNDHVQESHQRKRTKVERERFGSGSRTVITKLKYKKVVSKIASDDVAAVSHPAMFLKPTEPEIQNTKQSMHRSLEDPADPPFGSLPIVIKNSMDSLQIPRNLMAHDLSLLDMPGAFVEANETDFMLDDLEVALPSNLESGLSHPTASGVSSMLLIHDSSSDSANDELEHRRVEVGPCDLNLRLFCRPML